MFEQYAHVTTENLIAPSILWAHVLIIGVATVGLIATWRTWMDAGKKECGVRKILVVSTCLTIISAAAQMPILFDLVLFSAWKGWMYNLITLGIAMVKFAHKALVAVPDMMISKIVGSKNLGENLQQPAPDSGRNRGNVW